MLEAELKTMSEIVGFGPKTILKYYQHVSTRQRRNLIDNMDPIQPLKIRNPAIQSIAGFPQKRLSSNLLIFYGRRYWI